MARLTAIGQESRVCHRRKRMPRGPPLHCDDDLSCAVLNLQAEPVCDVHAVTNLTAICKLTEGSKS